jgi:CRISPR-associated protein Csd1
MLLTAVVQRIRADGAANSRRASLCRAVLQRDLRFNKSKEIIPVGLDKNNANPAYRLGRLFALYEWAEESAENRNATLRDKYFGAASSTPARVFPLLMRGSTHNLSKLRKGGKAGLAVVIDREIAEVMSDLPDPLPRALALEEQGRFFMGYYHQERDRFTSRKRDGDAQQGDQERKAS